jgi:hypothetical protein
MSRALNLLDPFYLLFDGRGRARFNQNKMPITTLNLEAASSDTTSRRALSQLSQVVAKSKRIVVVTGAGISCSSGIPVSIGLLETTAHRFSGAVVSRARLVRYLLIRRRLRFARLAHWHHALCSLGSLETTLDYLFSVRGLSSTSQHA